MRSFFSFVVLIALVLRAAVPAGFMLAPHADQTGLDLVICTAAGAKTVVLGDDPAPPTGRDASSAGCIYGAPITLAASLDPQGLITTVEWHEIVYLLERQQFNEPPATSASSARGPPHALI